MRICFIGDSFINGTGDDDALGWTGRIVARARGRGQDITGYNLGIRRDTSADIAARWRAEAERRLPPRYRHEGRLIFGFGTNDCADDEGVPRVSLERALANAEAILRDAASFAPTLMIGPPPALDNAAADDRTRLLSVGLEPICAGIGVPFLAVFDFVAACEPWRGDAARGDGTHPNRNGYAALADFIWRWRPFQAWLENSE